MFLVWNNTKKLAFISEFPYFYYTFDKIGLKLLDIQFSIVFFYECSEGRSFDIFIGHINVDNTFSGFHGFNEGY